MMYHCTGCHCRRTCYRQKCKFTPEAVCCCLQTCNFGLVIYTVPVHQVLPPDKLTQASYKVYKCLRLLVVVYKLVNVVLTLEW